MNTLLAPSLAPLAASFVKQNFGEALARAQKEPLGIWRHKQLVAALVSPDWLANAQAVDPVLAARREARAEQRELERERLLRHHRTGIELLCAPKREQLASVSKAKAVVDRWESEALTSADYSERWREWLALPVNQLVLLMCSDAPDENGEVWGPAMRQNSPFTALPA
jgi:hypothetical protein